ncbi:hypothetical protein R1flu_023917 [Riccia fluitans]|uniref:Uncharacterized protein n=1 Tax=Riccia fluitans TaxID=41844 RepID=A0ABD1XTE7_9MARC
MSFPTPDVCDDRSGDSRAIRSNFPRLVTTQAGRRLKSERAALGRADTIGWYGFTECTHGDARPDLEIGGKQENSSGSPRSHPGLASNGGSTLPTRPHGAIGPPSSLFLSHLTTDSADRSNYRQAEPFGADLVLCSPEIHRQRQTRGWKFTVAAQSDSNWRNSSLGEVRFAT